MKAPSNIAILKALGLGLALVSMGCEIVLFMDYAQSYLDKAFAFITALALVGCQFAFMGAAIHQVKTHKRFWFAGCLFATLGVLFFVSVAGTASYFESRFEVEQQSDLKNTGVYKIQKAFMDDYLSQAQAFKAAAKVATAKGSAPDAGYLLRQAKQATAMAQQAAQKLQSIPTPTQSSGATLAGNTGGWLWVVLAALVDMCPLLCFAVISLEGKPASVLKPKIETPTTENKTVKNENSLKPYTNKQIKHAQDNRIMVEILTGVYGNEPGVREVMRKNDIKSYPRMDAIFSTLKEANKIKQDENSKQYQLIKKAA